MRSLHGTETAGSNLVVWEQPEQYVANLQEVHMIAIIKTWSELSYNFCSHLFINPLLTSIQEQIGYLN